MKHLRAFRLLWVATVVSEVFVPYAAAQSHVSAEEALAGPTTIWKPSERDDRPMRRQKPAADSDAADPPAEATTEPPPAAAASHQRVARKHVHHEHHKSHASGRRRGRQPNATYRRLRDEWHAAVAQPVVPEVLLDAKSRLPLVIVPVNGGDMVSLVPQRDDGGFSDADLALAARAFAPKGMIRTHPIAPHLLDLVYRTMLHFKAPLVHLVSGYRPDRAGSRHTQGRAIDMVIPGVTNEELAVFARKIGYCGVGIYPKSGFVHLDVRDASFFWVDESLPDERSHSIPILPREAAAADAAARERGEAPDAYVPGNDREDRAAARSYAKRAKRRRAAAERARAAEPAQAE